MSTRSRIALCSLLAILGNGGLEIQSTQAAVITQWTFEASIPITAGPHNAEVGTGTAVGFHAGATTYSNPVGNGSQESFSSTNWAIGDYYQFNFNSAGMTNLSLSFDQTSSNTGPRDFMVQTTLDGITWTNLLGTAYSLSPITWSSVANNPASTFAYALPDGTIGVRLTDWSTTAANGGSVGSAGTNRVDNVTISGDPAPVAAAVPEPASAVIAAAFALSLGLFRLRRREPKALAV